MNTFKYHILTFGCQMNKNDSERLAGVLESLGLSHTEKPEEADVLFINTCSVRQHAEDRVYGLVREWQKYRINKPHLVIGVTGCMPGRDQDGKLQKKLPGVDLFFPISDLPSLPMQLKQNRPEIFPDNFENLEEYWDFVPRREQKISAFITIQNGCNNFCTYCVVPHSRGREKNRLLKDIIFEIKEFVRSGGVEVVLLGQVVNNYKIFDRESISQENIFKDKDDFAALLWEINNIKGLERINWTAADPQYFNGYQVQALALPKQVNYLHLPVQSGDNEILKKMNRKYTREDYIDLVKKIKQIRPGIALGTDIIVGFCGETEEQFQNTFDLFKICDFDISYHAMYSQRSGTVAAKLFKDDISKEEKKKRWQVLQDYMEKNTWQKNQIYKDKSVSVLVDKVLEDGWLSGNSSEMKLTRFKGDPSLLGHIVKVDIFRPEEWILWGRMI